MLSQSGWTVAAGILPLCQDSVKFWHEFGDDRETQSMGMDILQVLQRVRSVIRETFTEFGASPDEGWSESMLIRDGFFCGRRFKCAGLQAVWFMEEQEVKFFDRDGGVVRVLDLATEAAAPRRAA